MKRIWGILMRVRTVIRHFLLIALLLGAGAAFAHDESDIVITGVWARPTVGAEMSGMMMGNPAGGDATPMTGQDAMAATPMSEHRMGSTTPSAAYMQIENRGDHPVVLVAVMTPVAMTAEIHLTSIVNDVASMAEVEGGIEIAPGESVSLQPGSFHIMLMELTRDLAPGDAIALDLTFELRETDAEPMTVTVAAVVTDMLPMEMPLTLTESVLFAADGEMIPNALQDVVLPDGMLIYAKLENRGDADAPFASSMFMESAVPLSVLLDGALFEIDEYDVGVGETVEIVVALGDIAPEDVPGGALPFALVMSDETLLALAAAMPGAGMQIHE